MIGAAAGPWSILDIGQLAATKEYHREIMEFWAIDIDWDFGKLAENIDIAAIKFGYNGKQQKCHGYRLDCIGIGVWS